MSLVFSILLLSLFFMQETYPKVQKKKYRIKHKNCCKKNLLSFTSCAMVFIANAGEKSGGGCLSVIEVYKSVSENEIWVISVLHT